MIFWEIDIMRDWYNVTDNRIRGTGNPELQGFLSFFFFSRAVWLFFILDFAVCWLHFPACALHEGFISVYIKNTRLLKSHLKSLRVWIDTTFLNLVCGEHSRALCPKCYYCTIVLLYYCTLISLTGEDKCENGLITGWIFD